MPNLSKKFQHLTIFPVIFGLFAVASAAEAPFVSSQIHLTLKDPLVIGNGTINFGAVLPSQNKSDDIFVSLSQDFLSELRVKTVTYTIEKLIRPKSQNDSIYCNNVSNFPQGQIENNLGKEYFQKCFLPLCPFISIEKKSGENPNEVLSSIEARPIVYQNLTKTFSDVLLEQGVSNSDPKDLVQNQIIKDIGVSAFNYPYTQRGIFEFPFAQGILSKEANDLSDGWTITLKTPCFEGRCLVDNSLDSFDKIPQILKDKEWGCDIVISIVKTQ